MKTIYGFDSDEVRNKWIGNYLKANDSDRMHAQISAARFYPMNYDYWITLLEIVEEDIVERTGKKTRYNSVPLGRMRRPSDADLTDLEREVMDIFDYGF